MSVRSRQQNLNFPKKAVDNVVEQQSYVSQCEILLFVSFTTLSMSVQFVISSAKIGGGLFLISFSQDPIEMSMAWHSNNCCRLHKCQAEYLL